MLLDIPLIGRHVTSYRFDCQLRDLLCSGSVDIVVRACVQQVTASAEVGRGWALAIFFTEVGAYVGT